MNKSSSDIQLNNKFGLELESRNIEKRKLQRREQSDRREIVRFGYDITTRRSGQDRRESLGDCKGCELY
jgi:hypothetical protein